MNLTDWQDSVLGSDTVERPKKGSALPIDVPQYYPLNAVPPLQNVVIPNVLQSNSQGQLNVGSVASKTTSK